MHKMAISHDGIVIRSGNGGDVTASIVQVAVI